MFICKCRNKPTLFQSYSVINCVLYGTIQWHCTSANKRNHDSTRGNRINTEIKISFRHQSQNERRQIINICIRHLIQWLFRVAVYISPTYQAIKIKSTLFCFSSKLGWNSRSLQYLVRAVKLLVYSNNCTDLKHERNWSWQLQVYPPHHHRHQVLFLFFQSRSHQHLTANSQALSLKDCWRYSCKIGPFSSLSVL